MEENNLKDISQFLVVQGTFNNNNIICADDTIIRCITYNSIRQQIEGKKGYFHLKKLPGISIWVIFEYVLDV